MEIWDKLCIIDTENRSGSLYVGTVVDGLTIGEYNAINMSPPFHPKGYLEAIQVAENAGMEFLIIDSLTHAWSGEGGMLEIQGNAAERTKNSYTAWREVTPLHNKLVDKLLQCNMHVMVALRAKTEYTLEDGANGKKTPVKKGMAPIFRDGIEYEFTSFFDVEQNHTSRASKDRTGLFDGEYFTITPKTGAKLYGWLADGGVTDIGTGVDTPTMTKATPSEPVQGQAVTNELVDSIIKAYTAGMSQDEKRAVAAEIKAITGGKVNCMAVDDPEVLDKLYKHFKGKGVNA